MIFYQLVLTLTLNGGTVKDAGTTDDATITNSVSILSGHNNYCNCLISKNKFRATIWPPFINIMYKSIWMYGVAFPQRGLTGEKMADKKNALTDLGDN